jgi:hypothetical protein
MVVLPSTDASRYQNCCVDGGTSPENFGSTHVITCNYVVWSPLVINGAIGLPRREMVIILCNNRELSDVPVPDTGILSVLRRRDAQEHWRGKDSDRVINFHHDYCHNLGFKLKPKTINGMGELPLRKLLGHCSGFEYTCRSFDQGEKLLVPNESELSTSHEKDNWNFELTSYVGMATLIALMLLLCIFVKNVKYGIKSYESCCRKILH